MKYKYVLFDLDGTLIDTNRLIIDCFKHTYKAHLDLDVSEEEILKHFGEPLIITLRRYSEEKHQEMFETYVSFNEAIHDDYVTLCPGVRECLEGLKSLGCTMAVVTSKRRRGALKGLELFGIKDCFKAIVALEDTERHKPEPEPILRAIELLGADLDSVLMVGDSIFDIECASNAGVKSVLVNWSAANGFQDEQKTPDYTVRSMEEVIDIVRG